GHGNEQLADPVALHADDSLALLVSTPRASGTALSAPTTVASPGGGSAAAPTAPLPQERSVSSPAVNQVTPGTLHQSTPALTIQPLAANAVHAVNLAD